jgi:hypothetical protein
VAPCSYSVYLLKNNRQNSRQLICGLNNDISTSQAYCLCPPIDIIFTSRHKLNSKYTPAIIPLSRNFCDFQENDIKLSISSEKEP